MKTTGISSFAAVMAASMLVSQPASAASPVKQAPHTAITWRNHLGLGISLGSNQFQTGQQALINLTLYNRTGKRVTFWRGPCDPSALRVEVVDSKGRLVYRWHTKQQVCEMLAILHQLRPGHALRRQVHLRMRWTGNLRLRALAAIPGPRDVKLRTGGIGVRVGAAG